MEVKGKSRIIRIFVEGYDTSLPRIDVDEALRKHFVSHVNIVHVHVPIDVKSGSLNSFAFIYVDEECEEEVLKLDRSEMGGRILQIKAYPFHENHLDQVLAPLTAASDSHQQRLVEITGFDTSITRDEIFSALNKHLSLNGVVVYRDESSSSDAIRIQSTARMFVSGHDNVEKALKLSGSHVEGWTFVVTRVLPWSRKSHRCGYVVPEEKILANKKRNTAK